MMRVVRHFGVESIPRSKETDSVHFPSPYLSTETELVRSTGKFGIIGTETVRRRNHLEIWVRVRVRVRAEKKNGSTGTEFRLEIDGKYINVLKYSTIFEV